MQVRELSQITWDIVAFSLVYVFQNSFCLKHPDSVGQFLICLIWVHSFNKPRAGPININK